MSVGSFERKSLGQFDAYPHARTRFAQCQAAPEVVQLDICRAQGVLQGRNDGGVLDEHISLRDHFVGTGISVLRRTPDDYSRA
jgi:hypothetical protein